MKALLELLESDDVVEPYVEITSLARDEDSLTLRVVVRDQEDGDFLSRWRVLCTSPLDYRLLPGDGPLRLHGEAHSAARQFLDPRVDLFFTGKGTDPLAAAEALHAAHLRIAGEWIPFDRYLNSAFRPAELLRKGSGKLASGPVFLVDEYARVVTDFKVSTSRVAEFAPAIDLPRVPDEDRLSLLQVGSSFVVAQEFAAGSDGAG
jgi:hypothetical protein